MKPMGPLSRVAAEFLETAAREMPPEDAEVLLRSVRLLRGDRDSRTITAQSVEPQKAEPEPNPEPIPMPEGTPAQEEGVKVLNDLLGCMLSDAGTADKIVFAVSEWQRRVRENGVVAGDARIELTFSRPAGQKVAIAISEDLDKEELEKDLSAARRLGFDCLAGYVC